jgi:excisionase family DNA binding protein
MQPQRLAYTIPQACTVSGIGRTSLYATIRSGELVAHKIGRRTVVIAEDLKSWLQSRPLAGAPGSRRGSGFDEPVPLPATTAPTRSANEENLK